MIHRHLQGQAWSLMAIESLLERGKLPDWREFGRAVRQDRTLAEAALHVCDGPVDEGSSRTCPHARLSFLSGASIGRFVHKAEGG